METWKQLPNAPAYEVSDLGNVRLIFGGRWGKKGKPRKFWEIRGYKYVSLCLNGAGKAFMVHRLVMLAFCGASDLQVNHKNGNKADNRLENLEYVDGAANRDHAMHVLDAYPKGSGHPNSKLTEEHVKKIRELAASGVHDKVIGPAFGITPENVYFIRKRKTWAHIH